MRAVQIKGYGTTEKIRLENVDRPTLKLKQVMVEVKAASINPFELSIMSGAFKEFMPFPMPTTMGGDLSGVVSQVGEGVTRFKVGDQVYGSAVVANGGSGTLADYAAANENNLAIRPMSVSYESAASLPLTGASAVQAIDDHLQLATGRKILIHGGAGGIGSLAVQLAKARGAHVATTVSPDDLLYARELGADEVIDYKSQDFTTIIRDYDCVFDTVGGEIVKRSIEVLRSAGMLVTMKKLEDKSAAHAREIEVIEQSTKTDNDRLSRLATLVDEGMIKPVVAKIFPLELSRSAYEMLESGSPRGKVVVKVA